MVTFSKKHKIIVLITGAVLVLLVLLLMIYFSRCVPKLISEATTTASAVVVTSEYVWDEDLDAVVFEDADVDRSDILDQLDDTADFGYPSCPSAIKLLISDRPGRPGFDNEATPADIAPDPLPTEPEIAPFVPEVIMPPLVTTQPSFIIPQQTTTPTPLPADWITVTSPSSGSKLTAGSSFTLRWTMDDIGRTPTFNILLSVNGGASYTILAADLTDTSYVLTLPATPLDHCYFRVDVYVSTSYLGYGVSPAFGIVAPTPTEIPAPSSVYVPADNAFISSEGNATRWFSIEYDLSDVASVVWQVSTLPFPCDFESSPDKIPRLIATGSMDPETSEFAVDFASLMSRYEIVDGVKPTDILPNQGSDYEPVTDKVLLPQRRRILYIRAVALDENDRPIATPGNGVEVIYGEPELDLGFQAIAGNPVEKSLVIECPKEPDGPFEALSDKGFAVWAPSADHWTLTLDNIPTDSVEIDLQLSSIPFSTQSTNDFSDPAGLVYRSQVTGLSYTTVTRYYHWNFSDFAPAAESLGNSTVLYYLRAVCYVPDGPTGSLRPVISETTPVFYTGDPLVFAAISYDPPDPEPEEVVVESNAPYTYLQRYITAQWPIPKSDQYFEVTRPIQAEEMCFSITNNKTGDFLLPYNTHMSLYPQTTRAEYQATLDKMLPVGAWFHLTLTESAWSQLWNEFVELAKQTYDGIRSAYNGIKSGIAVFIADQFSFLGADARNLIEQAVTKLIDAGLASVGLPPSLPDFETMAGEGLDYCLRVALAETGAAIGVPVDEIPPEVRDQVTDEVKNRIESLAEMNRINPLNVDFLKPASEAAYRPAYVDVRVYNQHSVNSPTGTLTVSFYPVNAPHYNFYEYVTLPVPSLGPGEETFIRVYLKPDNTDHGPTYRSYYYGDSGDCLLTVRVRYDVPDINEAALIQGVSGSDPSRPDEYAFDYDPLYEFLAKMPPGENIFPANQYYE
ncbi:MAG: hypothetical protein JW817_03110 [Clostridiales bacterium]|nr:hypothetical protein [Clostridiales bacterium]